MAPRPITVFGNITHDPELHDIKGTPRATFTVAQNHRRYNRDTQQWEDAGVDYYSCTAWGQLATAVAEALHRGAPAIVVGTIKSRRVTDPDTGQNRTFWDITADQVGHRITPTPRNDGSNHNQQQYPTPGGNTAQNAAQQGFSPFPDNGFGDAGAPPF